MAKRNRKIGPTQIPDSIWDPLESFFHGDKDKVRVWLTTENPHFGGCEPVALISKGRVHKVEGFINASRERNGWGEK